MQPCYAWMWWLFGSFTQTDTWIFKQSKSKRISQQTIEEKQNKAAEHVCDWQADF